MKPCPRCAASLEETAANCSCGWTDRKITPKKEAFVFIPCARMSCDKHANTRVLTKTGWANFCPHHYSTHFLDKAEQTCYNLKLDTVQQKREYVREKMKRFLQNLRPVAEIEIEP